jgi:hypothetical protein
VVKASSGRASREFRACHRHQRHDERFHEIPLAAPEIEENFVQNRTEIGSK